MLLERTRPLACVVAPTSASLANVIAPKVYTQHAASPSLNDNGFKGIVLSAYFNTNMPP